MPKYNALYEKILDICSEEVREQQQTIADINLYLSQYLRQNDIKFLVESLINIGARHRLITVGYLDDIRVSSSLYDVGEEYESALERHVNSGQYGDLLLYKVIKKNISDIEGCFVVITSAYLRSHNAINEPDLYDVLPEIKNFVGNLFSVLPGQLATKSLANEGVDCHIASKLSSDCELQNHQSTESWDRCLTISSHSIYQCKIKTSIKYEDPQRSITADPVTLSIQLDVFFFKNMRKPIKFWSRFINELCVEYGINTPLAERSRKINIGIETIISRAMKKMRGAEFDEDELLFAIAPIPKNSKDFDKKQSSLYVVRRGNTLFEENRENLYISAQENFNTWQQSCAQENELEQEFQIERHKCAGINVKYIQEFGIICLIPFVVVYKDRMQVSAAYANKALPLSVNVDQHNAELHQSTESWESYPMISNYSIYQCKIKTSIKYKNPQRSTTVDRVKLSMQFDVLFFEHIRKPAKFWPRVVKELCARYGIVTPSLRSSNEMNIQIKNRISRAMVSIDNVKPDNSKLLFAIAPIPINSKDFDKKKSSLYVEIAGDTVLGENRERLYILALENFNAYQQSCAQENELEREFQIESQECARVNVTCIQDFGIILIMSFFGVCKDRMQVSAEYTSKALPLSVTVDQHNAELQSQSNCYNKSVAQSLTDEHVVKLIKDYDIEADDLTLLEGYTDSSEYPMSTLTHANNVNVVDGQQMGHSIA